MAQQSLSVIRFRLRSKLLSVRKCYFRLLGMQIRTNVTLGKITCEWPNKITIGNDCIIQDKVDFRISFPFDENNFIRIGNRVFIGRCCEFNASSRIIIGDDCKIASSTTVVDVGHKIGRDTTINQQATVSEEIVIGNDVWIGTGSIILKGVSIGEGSVIGAGSLVNKSIPKYQVWAGSPARFIANRN